jgi:serine protease
MIRTVPRGRRLGRIGLAAASTIVIFGGMVATAAPATASTATTPAASTNPYAPNYQHSYRHGAVPTRDTLAKMNSYSASHPNAVTPNDSTQNLAYGGGVDGIGVTTGHEQVYLVFWGTQWGTQSTDSSGNLTFSNDTAGAAPRLQNLFKGIGTNGELWSGVMTQYCEGVATGTQNCGSSGTHVAYPTGGAYAGVWYDNSAAEPSAATGLQIGNEAVKAASHFGNTSASLNRNAQYDIISAKGTNPDNYKTGGFCAWHDWNGDVGASSSVGDVAFTNMPYLLDVGTSCGQNFVNSGTAGNLDGFTIVNGHEYSETITDQNPAGGYTDSSGEENADKCAWVSPGTHGGAGNVAFADGSYAMQGTWSNDSVSGTGDCEISHTIFGGGGGGSVTVTNPGSQTGTVGTATSLTLSASGGVTPYTWTATGLPAGLSINASTGVISGTPTTATTYSVTATATDSTSPTHLTGSTTFSWVINPSGGGGCSSPGQKLGNPGFETGSAAPWTATAGVIDSSSSEPAHSGSWKAWLDGYGTTHTDTLSQSVTLPSGCSSYSFTFYLHIDTAETTTTTQYDKLTVKAGSTTLVTYSNLNHATGYQLHTFSLAAFAGTTVTLTFTGTEDSSLQTSFVVDDTAVTVS